MGIGLAKGIGPPWDCHRAAMGFTEDFHRIAIDGDWVRVYIYIYIYINRHWDGARHCHSPLDYCRVAIGQT